MADVEIKMTSNIDAVLAATNAAIERALEAVGIQCESYAKRNLTEAGRVNTDRLRGSITHEINVNEQAVYIGTNVKYAPYVEYGTGIYADEGGRQTPWSYQDEKGKWHRTVGMKPSHFLSDAVQQHLDEYRQIIDTELQKG